MARTVIAVYDDLPTAHMAVRGLEDAGFSRETISLIASDQPSKTSATQAGLNGLSIPGFGPALAAGPLSAALSTQLNGILGVLTDLGIPKEEAGAYAESVRRGGSLVTVRAGDFDAEKVMNILNDHTPVDIAKRAGQWREEGWQGFDPQKPDVQAVAAVHSQAQASGPSPLENRPFAWENARQTDADDKPIEYRSHYDTYIAQTGYPYDYYLPAYRFGYGLASVARYQNSVWAVIAPDVEHDWERKHPGTWERFEAAIRHAWEDETGKPYTDRP